MVILLFGSSFSVLMQLNLFENYLAFEYLMGQKAMLCKYTLTLLLLSSSVMS